MVNKAKEHIKLGDIFQVVLSQRFDAKLTKKPLQILNIGIQLKDGKEGTTFTIENK